LRENIGPLRTRKLTSKPGAKKEDLFGEREKRRTTGESEEELKGNRKGQNGRNDPSLWKGAHLEKKSEKENLSKT